MKAYFTNLSPRAWILLAVPLIVIGYPVVNVVVRSVIRAVVPEVVRQVLTLI